MHPTKLRNSGIAITNRSFDTLIETETIPENAIHWGREHFIPVARADWRVLMTDLAVEGGLTPEQFEEFCALLDTLVHMQSYHDHAELSENYSKLDPDSISERIPTVMELDSADQLGQLALSQLDQIMVRANYQKLNRAELLEALQKASEFGIPMTSDFTVFKRFGVYVRGKVIGKRVRRRLSGFYRREEIDVPLYQRLVICFQVIETASNDNEHRSDCLYIKSFKNIPQHDIDMLLPGTKVRMTMIDRGKIVLPTLSGLAILIFRLFAVVSLGLFALISLLSTTIGYALKTVFGYFRTKNKYQHNLTKNLYYQSLGNNAGVLQQLQNEAEVQDIQECLLAYTILLLNYPQGATARQLDLSAERFIQEAVDFPVNFEVDDALRKLFHLNLVTVNSGRKYVAIKITSAIDVLQISFRKLIDGYSKSVMAKDTSEHSAPTL